MIQPANCPPATYIYFILLDPLATGVSTSSAHARDTVPSQSTSLRGTLRTRGVGRPPAQGKFANRLLVLQILTTLLQTFFDPGVDLLLLPGPTLLEFIEDYYATHSTSLDAVISILQASTLYCSSTQVLNNVCYRLPT